MPSAMPSALTSPAANLALRVSNAPAALFQSSAGAKAPFAAAIVQSAARRPPRSRRTSVS